VIVSVRNLTHRYNSRVALDDLSFDVAPGTIFGLLGPNGSGKSTLFRILTTMMAPTSGRVTIAGIDAVRRPDEVRRRIGVVFQSPSLDRKLTVRENLTALGRLYGLSGAHLQARIGETLERLGLADRAGELVETLSGGLRRRVEIARALLAGPSILLFDEPSSGLDPAARLELVSVIAGLRDQQGVTVLLATHVLEEAERCDRLLLLHRGRRVAEGTPAELKSRVGGDVVVLEVAEPEVMRGRILERFGLQAQAADGALRVEIPNGHRFIAELVEAFPGAIRSIGLHRPTLEDVFLDETGVSID
jgi:ABC-2 type transport system ATP-binding protein